MGIYVAPISGIALAASTARVPIGLVLGSGDGLTLQEFGVSFDSSAAGQGVLVELCKSTQATAGTPGTAPTVTQIRGVTSTANAVANTYAAGSQPTVLTPIRSWYVAPSSGLVIQFPLGTEWATPPAAYGVMIRVTPPAAVTPNCAAYMQWDE